MTIEQRVGIFVLGAIAIFLYLTFNIGAWRIDRSDYDTYVTYFADATGLEQKAAIKSSGVRIGWVDSIQLRENGMAEVHLKVHKSHKLAMNAYAGIQQEGLLGQKNIELDAGDFSTGILVSGSVLSVPGKSTANVGDLIDQFRDIANSVSDIAYSVKNVLGTKEGEEKLRATLHNAENASQHISDASEAVSRITQKNEGNINTSIKNITKISSQLEQEIPRISQDIHSVSSGLTDRVFPELVKMGPAFEAFEDTAVQAREGFREAEQVMEKINTGKGLVGKLINEADTYADIKKTVRGLKEYVNRVQSLQIYIDLHSENGFKYNTNKGYCDVKIRVSSDYFYQIQLNNDEYGVVRREVEDIVRRDQYGNRIDHRTVNANYGTATAVDSRDYLEFPDRIERVTRYPYSYAFGFQIGKRFDRLAFRLGLFENTFGVACDFYVPLKTDVLHWISTLQVYDMRGSRRIDDTRPHVKWLNSIYFMRGFYTCFGFDDVISKRSATPFVGGGFKFTDSDIKYFLGMFSGLAGSAVSK